MANQDSAHGTASAPAPPTAGGLGWLAVWRHPQVLAAVIALVVLVIIPPIYDSIFGFSAGFELHRLSLIGIFIIAALAQNILTGYAAQPSLGNAAFFGVGAYLLAWTSTDLHYPFIVCILIAMVAAAGLGVIVGGPALRVSGAYLAIATLGLVFVTQALLDFWDKTNSRQDYELTNLPDILQNDHALYYVLVGIVTVTILLSANLLRGRVGRAWMAIRDNESAAEAFGVNLTRYKLLAFVISATLTSLAGALYATWATTASSSTSSADLTIAFLAMIVVGGLGSIVGSVLGALFVGFLPLLLGQLPNVITAGPLTIQVTTLSTGIYGMLLLLTLIYFPNGLSSLVTRGQQALSRTLQRGGSQ